MPVLPPEEFAAYFFALPQERFNSLFGYVSELKKETEFGHWMPNEQTGPNHFSMGGVVHSKLVSDIVSELYGLGLIVGFDWGGWEEGRAIFRRDPFTVDDLDAVTICTLITAVVRNDRFCEGALLASFTEGKMQVLLYALEDHVRKSRN